MGVVLRFRICYSEASPNIPKTSEDTVTTTPILFNLMWGDSELPEACYFCEKPVPSLDYERFVYAETMDNGGIVCDACVTVHAPPWVRIWRDLEAERVRVSLKMRDALCGVYDVTDAALARQIQEESPTARAQPLGTVVMWVLNGRYGTIRNELGEFEDAS